MQTSGTRQWAVQRDIGRTGPELDKDLEHEVAALWSEVSRLASIKPSPGAARKGRRHA